MRVIALCLLQHRDCLLLQEFWHEFDNYKYYRPPGGGVEHGERAEEAVRREMWEELNSPIDDVRLVEVFENLFRYGGEQRHEIVFLFQATPLGSHLFASNEVVIRENGRLRKGLWVPLSKLLRREVVICPQRLSELLLRGRLPLSY
ncbi:MAG: NUDIX domain-containing protein [Saprospiraceae bacterium]|nr:NUDIX domain-containing protein [Saprospiraceae bacterium]MDW8483676.1 NUDIX domain-containing protein [Saprospiraceae bacterium]